MRRVSRSWDSIILICIAQETSVRIDLVASGDVF